MFAIRHAAIAAGICLLTIAHALADQPFGTPHAEGADQGLIEFFSTPWAADLDQQEIHVVAADDDASDRSLLQDLWNDMPGDDAWHTNSIYLVSRPVWTAPLGSTYVSRPMLEAGRSNRHGHHFNVSSSDSGLKVETNGRVFFRGVATGIEFMW